MVSQTFDLLPEGVRVGEVVAGKYRVEETIGAGAMGVVVAAWHLLLEERVAIKFLLPPAVQNQDAVARFVREARAAVKIKSEHVARVADIAFLDDGTPYIVMEFLEGEDLAAWLRHRGPLPVTQAVEFILQACEALAEAHANGIVHRDLKPANLFVVRRVDGVRAIKVLDFGISKIMARSAAGPTTTESMIVGSPVYMSPEQMESAKDVDAQTDIWALGVILCELVTGRLPFEGASLPQVYAQIVASGPGPRHVLDGIVPELQSVIAKCIERHRERRYHDVGELAVALMRLAPKRAHASVDRIARVLGGGVVMEPELDAPLSAPAPHTLAVVERTLASHGSAPRRAKGVRLTAVGIGVGLGIALLVVPVAVHLLGAAKEPAPGDLARSATSPLSVQRAPIGPAAASESATPPSIGPAPLASSAIPPSIGAAAAPPPAARSGAPASASSTAFFHAPHRRPLAPLASAPPPSASFPSAVATPPPPPASAASSLDITPFLLDPK